ncbi:MAG TPA: DUF302 domain-containing protein [Caldilineaceae bacterium]|nr:DUF302 domain-containing protein [Caldilineaceae bacterium]
MSTHYGFGCRLPLDLAAAKAAVTTALKQEGFGVLTEIDVQATLKAKLGVDYRPYVILGACNPQLAYQALQAEPELGLLLPCNVILYDNGDQTSTVSIVDPVQMLGVVHNPALEPVAAEANIRLRRVVEQLTTTAPD